MTVLDNTTKFILHAILTGVLPFLWKRLGSGLWQQAQHRNLVGPAIAGISGVLTICVAYFVARREAICGNHPEFCRRDDIVVLTSAARSVWSPFGYALAGLHFVDYLSRGLMGYVFASVGALVASTTAQVRGASNVLEYTVCLVSSFFLQCVSIALCMATLALAVVYLRHNGSFRASIERTKVYVLAHGSYRVVGVGLFILLTVLGWWAGPTNDFAAVDDAALAAIRADILSFKNGQENKWEFVDCAAGKYCPMTVSALEVKIEHLKHEMVSLEVEADRLRVEAEETRRKGKDIAKRVHDVDVAISATKDADALLAQAERLQADALLLPQRLVELEQSQHDLHQMLETVCFAQTLLVIRACIHTWGR